MWLADYQAWGNTAKVVWREQVIDQMQVSPDELQPIRFQGQYFDEETGLHYNRFRYYDPDVGMFTSRDPIGLMGGDNVFAYAPNPTGWIDPLGLKGGGIATATNASTSRPTSTVTNINSTPGFDRANLDAVKRVKYGVRCGGLLTPCRVLQLCQDFWCPGESRNQCTSMPIARAMPAGMSHFDAGCECKKWGRFVNEEDAPPGAGYRVPPRSSLSGLSIYSNDPIVKPQKPIPLLGIK